ncbi:MAG: hypothetical protein M3Y65_06425 [Pseudomonadota bacterium]|nr:hypothetical protein [Pseudomonadota bacterium]
MKSTLLCLTAATVMTVGFAHAEDATGYWQGTIASSLKVFLQVNKTADGTLEGTLSVPQQGMVAKVDQLVATDDQLGFALLPLKASYAARWNSQDKQWTGTWRQGGQTTPLLLTRADAGPAPVKRPQEEAIAAHPAAYASTDVSFANASANIALAGTLTVPPGKGPFPAVVLVHGSGPIDRDETIFQHKLFLVLADHLTRQGIAVLRYDK